MVSEIRLPPSEDRGGRGIIGYIYFAGGALWPVLVVAKAGGVGDWAAYIGGLQSYGDPTAQLELVMDYGDKLNEAQARAFFPYIDGKYRE